jgi:hypothetical protein
MGQYTGNANWADTVYQFDETDVVEGGPNGTDNKPLKDLADRTAYLKAQIGLIDRLSDQIVFNDSANITGLLAGQLIVPISAGILILTLADAATFKHGAIVPIAAYCADGCVVNVQPMAGQNIFDNGAGQPVMYMHNKENLCLIALGDQWKVVFKNGNFDSVGEEVKGRKELNNTIALKGQLLQRSRYPRLWNFVQQFSMYGEITSEFLWNNYGVLYQSFFSNGDGATTFRLPDERGMFERMADLGRGVDTDRQTPGVGGYQLDELKSHTHKISEGGDRTLDNVNTFRIPTSNTDRTGLSEDFKLLPVGGIETRPKNISKLFLIKY